MNDATKNSTSPNHAMLVKAQRVYGTTGNLIYYFFQGFSGLQEIKNNKGLELSPKNLALITN
jgi:PII-like signaling protein